MEYDVATNQWYVGEKPAAPEMTRCRACGQMTVVHKQEAYGDTWTCTADTNCNMVHYVGMGD